MRKDQHSYRRHLLRGFKKRGVIAIAILFLLAVSILFYSYLSDSSLKLTGFSTKDVGEDPISFTANLDLPELAIEVKDATLEFEGADGEFFLSGLGFKNLNGIDADQEGFTGEILIDNSGKANIKGRANKVLIDYIDVNKGDRTMDIDVNELNFNSLKIENVYLDSFSFISSGDIGTGSSSLGLKDGTVEFEIRPFIGNMEMSGSNLKLDGKSDDILIKGVPK